MAPLVPFFALLALALATTVLASPHVPRGVYGHAHRAVARPELDVRADPLPQRKRSLNKRCVSRPTANSTSAAGPTSSAPINVAQVPSGLTSVAHTSSSPAYSPSPTTSSSSSSSLSPTTSSSSSYSPSPTTSTSSPAQTSSSSSSGSEPSYMYGTQSGSGTFYETGLGACGITNTDSDYIAAVSQLLFDTYPGYDGVNPNTNPVCNKKVMATYSGISVTITIVDRCTACAITDLDFSPSAFDTLANPAQGRIPITWVWI